MAKKKKILQIPYAPPARPAIAPSLPHSLTLFVFQSSHCRGWCDDFISHARMLKGYPLKESPRLINIVQEPFRPRPAQPSKKSTYPQHEIFAVPCHAVPCSAVAVMSDCIYLPYLHVTDSSSSRNLILGRSGKNYRHTKGGLFTGAGLRRKLFVL